jgi:hypothetical protein
MLDGERAILREELPVTDFSGDVLRAAELFDLTYRDTVVVSLAAR